MGLFDLFKSRKENNKPRKKKKQKIYPCNVLRLNNGIYASDSGYGDYSISYKIIRGKVNKTILKAMKKNEDTDMFNFIELKPITEKAIIKIYKNPQCQNHSDIPIRRVFFLHRKILGKVSIKTFK